MTEIQLWSEDATIKLKVVADSMGSSFRDARNETGVGTITVPDTKEYRDYLARDLVVMHVQDGVPIFAWTIEEDTRNPLADPPSITATGRGILCWYEWASVYPARGMKRRSKDVRYFGFGSGDMFGEDSLGGVWFDAFENERTVVPEGWPSATMWRIWAAPVGDVRPPGEEAWFIQGFNTTSGQYVRIDCAADDTMQLWMDDDLVIEMDGTNTTNPGGKVMKTVRMVLPAGDHWVSIKGSNRTQEDTDALGGANSGTAWVAARIAAIDDDDDLGDVLLLTSRFWRATFDEPGWTVGLALAIALNEAVERGVDRMFATGYTFTSDVDSNGLLWPHNVNRTWPVVSTDLLTLMYDLAEMGADIWMSPDKQLHAAMTRGTDRSNTVALRPAANLDSYGIKRKHKVRTFAAARTGAGWTQVSNAGGIEKYGRSETRIDLQSIDSIQLARGFVAGTLAQMASPVIETDGDKTGLIPWAGATPYKDFQLGDTVSVPDGKARVMGISNTTGPLGEAWFLELDLAQTGARTVSKTTSQLLRAIASSGGAASAGGRVRSASK